MAKVMNTYCRVVLLDDNGIEIAYVQSTNRSTKVVRDIESATIWDWRERGNAERVASEASHLRGFECKVVDFEVVQIERRVKCYRNRKEEEVATEA